MVDTMTREQRHRCMAAVKGKDTKPEMMVRRYLHSLGYRYGLHNKKLPGSPDLVLRKYRSVIFIHGCFWHGHKGCKYYRLPKTNEEFWQEKITRNKQRDQESVRLLREKGWNVIIIWECELKNKNKREETLMRLHSELKCIYRKDIGYGEIETFAVAAEPKEIYRKT